jgi:hypothetical protein
MNKLLSKLTHAGSALLLAGVLSASIQAHAAKFVIVNGDDPNVGLNDTTPAAPIGINTGKTLGEQRLIALNFIGGIWGRALGGNQTIEVLSGFIPQECSATNGVLASAGPLTANRDFPNARFPNTWYAAALANKLAKTDLDADGGEPSPELIAVTNVNVGKADCIAGGGWYYGMDDKAPAGSFDFVRTMLHEFGHGIGFLSFADESTGELFDGRPSIWEHYLVDGKTNKLWVNMTDAQRKASALNNQYLAWNGFQSFIGAQQTLTNGSVLDVLVLDNQGFATLPGGTPNFGANEGNRSRLGLLGFLTDTRAPGAACAPLTSSQASSVRGRVAVIDRGGCAFTAKALNAQNAGATAIIFVNNVPAFAGRPQFGVPDPAVTITISSTLISQQDGVRLRASSGATGYSFATATLLEGRRPLGTDWLHRPLLFAPTVAQPGSSVSHWDITATPNLLMEPYAEGDEATTLKPPRDLTLSLLKDIGW